MPPVVRWLALPVLAWMLFGCHAGAGPAGAPALGDLVRDYDREITPYFPFLASDVGLHEYDRVLANDIGAEYRAGMLALCTRYREGLRQVDPAPLAEEQRVTYGAFAFRLETCVAGYRFPWHLLPVNQAGSSWPSRFPILGSGRGNHPFKTPRNYEDFLGRVDGFVVWMDTAIANMREGIARGITQPRLLMERVLPQLDAQIVEDPTASLFWEPVRNFPPDFGEPTRAALTAKYRAAIEDKIVPAYRRLRVFIHDEYLPRCRSTSGFGDLPDGRAWYEYAVRVSTTTGMTPDEVYALGVSEVERIQRVMDAVRAEKAAQREPAPPRYRTLHDLLAGYAGLRADVDAAMPRLFGRFPRAGFEIRPIEAFRERSMPSSYVAASPDGSRPGVFYLNSGDLRDRGGAGVYRNLYLHEAVPGHHFQMSLQRENRRLPGFQRFGWYTAFGEGWALYAESLGGELGVYPHRADRLGMLHGELFRARRLVVDVGLHARGWTPEQAMDYLGGRSVDNAREVERYMAWPGQALGYKIGQLKILALRNTAAAALGPSFDVRAFHDEVLKDGALPLTVLEAKMDRWLAARRR
ncbi:MAG TPA: DUF885 domain-containing protein [Candidatus Binatia bacterium]|nr:DUF885 domain-containing protein [Candidatus Binatia bacterium]